MENELKNMVSGETYSRVNYGLEKYQKAKEAKEMMDQCTKVLDLYRWSGCSSLAPVAWVR